jgi:acyl carrier protein
MREQISEQVKKTLAETLNLKSTESIQMHTSLKDDLGLDSMSSLTFLMALEDNIDGFVVDADTLDVDHLASVESITGYVLQSLAVTAESA